MPATLIRPKTWATGDILPASDLNVYLRDNLRALYAAPACHVYGSVNQAIPNASDTVLVFQGEHFDNAGMHSPIEAPERITITVPGVYLVAANVSWYPETTGRRHLQIRVNGLLTIGADERMTTNVFGVCRQQAVGLHHFDAGDYVEALAGQDITSGGDLEVDAFWGGGPPINSPSMFAVRLAAGHELLKTWTTPPTFASAAALTATQLDQQLRDNVRVLFEPATTRAYRRTAQSLANTTDTIVTFDGENFDTNTGHDLFTATGRLTAQQAGVYVVAAGLTWALHTTGHRTIGIRVNGSTFIVRGSLDTDAVNGEVRQSVCTLWKAAAGDYIELVPWQSSGGSLDVQALLDSSPWLGMARVGEDTAVTAWTDPRDWAAGDILSHSDLNTYLRDNLKFLRAPPTARVAKSGVAAISDAVESIVNFDAERWDTDGTHDNATNNTRLTAQKPGIYLVFAHIQWASNAVGRRQVDIRLNGSGRLASVIAPASTLASTRQTVMTLWPLLAGDYVEALVYQTSGGAINVNNADQWSPELAMVRASG